MPTQCAGTLWEGGLEWRIFTPPIWPDLKSPHFTLSLHSFPSLGLHHCRQPRSRPPPSTDDISVTGSKRIRQRGGQHLCQPVTDDTSVMGWRTYRWRARFVVRLYHRWWHLAWERWEFQITDNVFLRHGWGLWSVIDERFRSSGSNQQRYRRRRCIIFNQSPANQIR